jgi:hypothetical protein
MAEVAVRSGDVQESSWRDDEFFEGVKWMLREQRPVSDKEHAANDGASKVLRPVLDPTLSAPQS